MSQKRLQRRLERCRTEYAPDDRVAHFDVTARETATGVRLAGTVSHGYLRDRAVRIVETAAEWTLESVDITIFEQEGEKRTITTEIAPVRGAPNSDAEQVTQVLYGAVVTAFDQQDAWVRVRTPDGYIGWVRHADVSQRQACRPDAIVQTPVVDADTLSQTLYAGIECEVLRETDDECVVQFRTGTEATLPTTAVGSPPPWPTGDAIVTTAREYLGTEYVWGGMTVDGIDCSGLAWMSYHRNGITLPRDADQQRQVGEPVERDELAPGDLLFFPGHVAISLGGEEYIHASGSQEGVVTNSLSPESDAYLEELDEEYSCARRIL